MHKYFHTVLGFCIWDAVALVVLVASVVVLVVSMRKQKKEERAYEDELAAKMAEEVSSKDKPDLF